MLVTITTTRPPATDLGYLLHKHPGKVQSWQVASGVAHVFYPEASDDRCTAALLLEVDPVALVRGHAGHNSAGHNKGKGSEPPGITHYVNDRPYAASSLMAVALKQVFGTALAGRCAARPQLADAPLPLEVRVPALRCAGGTELAERLLRPLGWAVRADPVPLDPPQWGPSRYVDLRLSGTLRLADALNHLYVLLPVLDDAKHYWVTSDEIDKLVRAGSGWLAGHPDKTLITRRYLAHRRELTASALARLAEADEMAPEDLDNAVPDEAVSAEPVPAEAAPEDGRPVPLAVQRREAVLGVLREAGVRSVADLGCGDGALTRELVATREFERIVAADVSARALAIAERRLKLNWLPQARRDRITLIQTALTYRDGRLAGLDAAVLMEVIEHVDEPRLPALERAVFGYAAPGMVIVTTPNAEHNPVYGMPEGALRHPDHRWEWTREQFRDWAGRTAAAYGYALRITGIGPDSPRAGPPTQMAVFSRAGNAAGEVTA